MTIPAHLVAAAGCLPPVWLDDNGRYRMDEGHAFRTGDLVDLSDPQTAFGVALKLDEWERGTPYADRTGWRRRVAIFSFDLPCLAIWTERMAARITHIGKPTCQKCGAECKCPTCCDCGHSRAEVTHG